MNARARAGCAFRRAVVHKVAAMVRHMVDQQGPQLPGADVGRRRETGQLP